MEFGVLTAWVLYSVYVLGRDNERRDIGDWNTHVDVWGFGTAVLALVCIGISIGRWFP